MKISKIYSARLRRIGRVGSYLGLALVGTFRLEFGYALVVLSSLGVLLYRIEAQRDLREDERESKMKLKGYVVVESPGVVHPTWQWSINDEEKVQRHYEHLLMSLDSPQNLAGNFLHLQRIGTLKENRTPEHFREEVRSWYDEAMNKTRIRRHAFVTRNEADAFIFAIHIEGEISPRDVQMTLEFPNGTEIWTERASEDDLEAGLQLPMAFNRRNIASVFSANSPQILSYRHTGDQSRSNVEITTSASGVAVTQTFTKVYVGAICKSQPIYISTSTSTDNLIVTWRLSSAELHGTGSGEIVLPVSQSSGPHP